MREFSNGDRFTVFDANKFKFSSLICYESIFHNLTRKFAKLGIDFFVNITNDAWTNSVTAHYQHFIMNVFTAIQSHLPFIRCGNSGISGVINEIGEITYSTIPLTKKNFIFKISYYPEFRSSFFSRYGDLFPDLLAIFAGIIIFISFFFNRKDIE